MTVDDLLFAILFAFIFMSADMSRNCGFFPGCNMTFVKKRRGDSSALLDVVPWNLQRPPILHCHELPIRNGMGVPINSTNEVKGN